MEKEYYDSIERFKHYALPKTLYKGESLDPDKVFFLEEGLCALTHLSDKGDESAFLYFQPGVMLGFLRTLILGMPSTVVAKRRGERLEHVIIARRTSKVYYMGGDKFLLLLQEEPLIGQLVLQSCMENLVNTLALSTSLSSKSAIVRICQTIIDFKEEEGERLRLPSFFTYAELSQYLSLHTITITKIFKHLIAEGVLYKEGRKVFIGDIGALYAIASGAVNEVSY